MNNTKIESSNRTRLLHIEQSEVVDTVITGRRKRPRYLTSWEESFRNFCPQRREQEYNIPSLPGTDVNNDNDASCKNRFGLVDLFWGNRWVRSLRERTTSIRDNSNKNNIEKREESLSSSKFFTLRLEHRHGGTTAKHFGEERFLLFRSDQAGAIAKVIFSSSPVVINDNKDDNDDNNDNNNNNNNNHDRKQQQQQQHTGSIRAANATVHLLFVKDTFRGFDLGGFLFVSCTSYLKELYCNNNNSNEIISSTIPSNIPAAASLKIPTSIRCRLDAEEDVTRHNKLVHFYEHLGCSINKRAKITFINNNDRETYRKIPMKIDLVVSSSSSSLSSSLSGIDEEEEEEEEEKQSNNIITTSLSSFLPVVLMSASGKRARSTNIIMDWLIVECEDGHLQLRTTNGRMLRLNQEGQCQLSPLNNEGTCNNSRLDNNFQLLRVSDILDKVLSDRNQEGYEEEEEKKFQQQQLFMAKEKELWMIRSSMNGSFMGLGCNDNLVFSEEASFWQVDENFCLTHTSDNPGRRQHHRKMWMKQSVEYVTLMRERYSRFDLHLMTIEEALNLTKYLQANPFTMSVGSSCTRGNNYNTNNTSSQKSLSSAPSLRTLLFHTAELARKEGHPDWVQLVALIHGLAGALTCVGSSSSTILTSDESSSNDDEDFDWTIYVDVRVIGCRTPSNATFSEFRHLNPDELDSRYNTRTGLYHEHVGLENVLLSWTSSEYMASMLHHNNVVLPKEAFAILRLFPLVDWHSRGKHTTLSNDDDEEIKSFVADFCDLCKRTQRSILSSSTSTGKEMSDKECHDLWVNHYSLIANKYGMGDGDILKW
jgi:hypothetical protein